MVGRLVLDLADDTPNPSLYGFSPCPSLMSDTSSSSSSSSSTYSDDDSSTNYFDILKSPDLHINWADEEYEEHPLFQNEFVPTLFHEPSVSVIEEPKGGQLVHSKGVHEGLSLLTEQHLPCRRPPPVELPMPPRVLTKGKRVSREPMLAIIVEKPQLETDKEEECLSGREDSDSPSEYDDDDDSEDDYGTVIDAGLGTISASKFVEWTVMDNGVLAIASVKLVDCSHPPDSSSLVPLADDSLKSSPTLPLSSHNEEFEMILEPREPSKLRVKWAPLPLPQRLEAARQPCKPRLSRRSTYVASMPSPQPACNVPPTRWQRAAAAVAAATTSLASVSAFKRMERRTRAGMWGR